jgi:PTH1 family peptidyl-tRNA hydrolase
MDQVGPRLVIGLGNPGEAYADTRHNVGFMALELFAREGLGAPCVRSNFRSSVIATGSRSGRRVVMAWPQTYMNLSGHAARELVAFYKVDPKEDMLVVHDEMDIPPGRVKASQGGGAAGHKGILSINEALGPDYARLRIGIGRQPRGPEGDRPGNVDWVLSSFADEELPLVGESLVIARNLIRVWISDGISAAQRLANRKPPKPKPKKAEGEGEAEGDGTAKEGGGAKGAGAKASGGGGAEDAGARGSGGKDPAGGGAGGAGAAGGSGAPDVGGTGRPGVTGVGCPGPGGATEGEPVEVSVGAPGVAPGGGGRGPGDGPGGGA